MTTAKTLSRPAGPSALFSRTGKTGCFVNKPNDDEFVLPEMSEAELDAAIGSLVAEIQDDIDSYEERAALQTIDDGLTTDQRAISAMDRCERFNGEHAVARAWLKHYAPHVGIFKRVPR